MSVLDRYLTGAVTAVALAVAGLTGCMSGDYTVSGYLVDAS